MPNETHEEQVARLTDMAEKKDESLSAELNAMSPQDRLKITKEMDALNATNRATNSNLPDIELTIEKDSNYDEQLTDIQMRTEKWGPDKYEDVYNVSPFRGNEKDMQVFKVPGLDENTDMDHPLKVTESTKNADGSTTERYAGELDDGNFNDTEIKVEITRDAEGKITSMNVKYDPPMNAVRFGEGGGGGAATMRHVDELQYTRQRDGSWTIDGPQMVYPQRWNRVLADARGEYHNVTNEDTIRRAAND